MKHFKLKQAIERAKAAGLRVARKYIGDGKVIVKVESDDGMQACAKSYSTGNASAQASYINQAVKGFTLVETGTLYRYECGVDLFCSDACSTLYVWNDEHKEWRASAFQFNPDVAWDKPKQILKVKVKVSKLASGLRMRYSLTGENAEVSRGE